MIHFFRLHNCRHNLDYELLTKCHAYVCANDNLNLNSPSSAHDRYGFLPSLTPLGVLENDGGTSMHGFCAKKFLGLNNTDIGSAGMIG